MALHDLIALMACELCMKSGQVEGRDLDNWLEAERIVTYRDSYVEDRLKSKGR